MEVSEEIVQKIVVEQTLQPLQEHAVPSVSAKTSSFREQKIASSGMGFLLQQMRAASANTTVVKPVIEQEIEPIPEVKVLKTPIRPDSVDYGILNEENRGSIKIEPIQVMNSCYNEGTTPKFNFAPNCSENNYVRSCNFSPDGKHLITDSEDRIIRIFKVEDDKLQFHKSIRNGDLIYDVACDRFGEQFATTSGGSPIKLWTYDGIQTATYHGINHLDELAFANCMQFDLTGEKLYAGYRGVVRRFEINRPGRQISELKTYVKEQVGQKSILSCIDMSPAMYGVFAIGSFGGCVGLYSDFTNSCDMFIQTQNRFITCLKYSSDGRQIFIGSRKSSNIECYDIRNSAKLLLQYSRPVTTGQRVHFKLDPSTRYLFSGSSNGDIRIFDLKSVSEDLMEPTWIIENASPSTPAGIDLHPTKSIVATAHGQRVFPTPLKDDEIDETPNEYLLANESFDNSLKLWRF